MRALFRVALAAAAITAFARPALAGNIALTGHDDDFHCGGSLLATDCQQLNAMVAFARAGSSNSTLPVLTFDMGSELTSDLISFGIPIVNINSGALVTSALFDPTLYSAFVVASDSTCGGCDNTPAGIENAINAQAAAIADFFNKGGGIVGLAGAGNAATYYNFVPSTASGFGFPPSTGYTQTACGATLGIPAVNGDATHNFFPEPGTGGVSSSYCVVERLGDPTTGTAETLALAGGTITSGTITTGAVPEPTSLTLLGLGLAGAVRRRLRRRA